MEVAAPDTVSGHLSISPSAFHLAPFGELERGFAWQRRSGSGQGFALDLTYGVSHTVMVGVAFSGAQLGSGERCDDCTTQTYTLAPVIRYHLVQGLRFDPWVASGIGARNIHIDAGTRELNYLGIEWLRLAVGGDWYASRNLALSPMLQLTTGVSVSRPGVTPFTLEPGAQRGPGHFWTLAAGMRITLDFPGK